MCMDRWSTTCLRDDRPIGMTTRVVSTVPDFRRTRADGGYPDSDLVMDRAGHLYGTTVEGGLGSGTMFLTHSGSIWAETDTVPGRSSILRTAVGATRLLVQLQ